MSDQRSLFGKLIRWGLLVAPLAVVAWISLLLVHGESEYRRTVSPDGHYIAIATFPPIEAMGAMVPGQSGDKAGHVRILGIDGTDYGRIPVPMVSMVDDIQWTDDGASICCGKEWNFIKREYSYWNEDETEKIVESAR
jgi:hypothetical protein